MEFGPAFMEVVTVQPKINLKKRIHKFHKICEIIVVRLFYPSWVFFMVAFHVFTINILISLLPFKI
jgi:hypothetical protein